MSLPKPYYQDDWCQIFCADCREILPELPKVDLVLTDPPWIAREKGLKRKSGCVAAAIQDSMTISYGELGRFDREIIEMAFQKTDHDMLVLCGFKELGQVISALDPIRGCFGWHKPNCALSINYPAAMDLSYIVWGAHKSRIMGKQVWPSSVFSVGIPTAGCISNGERFLEEKNGKAIHPAQGPIALYHRLLKPFSGTVMDPYAGTGTTLRAAKDLGRKSIGIEIEEKYCEIAVERLRQEVFTL